MATPASWSTQQLAEFLAYISSLPDEATALQRAAERVAEATDAEVGAVLVGDRAPSSVGFPSGSVPLEELRRVAEGESGSLDLPGVGSCRAVVVPLEDPLVGRLVVARAGDEEFSQDDLHLLRGMARVLALAVRMLRLVETERGLREESERQARDNASLLRSVQERQQVLEAVASIERLISSRAPLQEILDSVTRSMGVLLDAEMTGLRMADPEQPGTMTLVSSHGMDAELVELLRRGPVGLGTSGMAITADDVVVIHDYPRWQNAVPELVTAGVRSTLAAPVHEAGRVVGTLLASSLRAERSFSDADRLSLLSFAELVSLAVTDARRIEEVMDAAVRDPLTGLPNRRYFRQTLSERLARKHGDARYVGVLFLDLDRFKHVNDSLGHETGDLLLTGVARRLVGSVRPGDVVARLGGDEFTILLDGVTDANEASLIASRMLDSLRQPFGLLGRTLFVSASIGILLARPGRDRADDAMRRADLAMYEAKSRGSGNFAVYHPELNRRAMRRLQMESELRAGIERGELRVHYQPLVTVTDGRITGLEALVRWEHPVRGLVLPSEFIAIAEETGLIIPIGSWVLEEACRQACAWSERSPESPLKLSVNLSAAQFQQADLRGWVGSVLARTGFDPERLVLEITESVLIEDALAGVRRLNELRRLGVQVAIDDFGTGYSSLSYLKRFPVDVMKIDRSFVQTVADGPAEAAFAEAIVQLAHTLGLSAVAEGVETLAQLAQLRRLGCDEAQGYHFERPLEPGAVERLLEGLRVLPRYDVRAPRPRSVASPVPGEGTVAPVA